MRKTMLVRATASAIPTFIPIEPLSPSCAGGVVVFVESGAGIEVVVDVALSRGVEDGSVV